MSNISLYSFQKHAAERVETSWEKGNMSVLISIPTGGGKTIIFSSILKSKLNGKKRDNGKNSRGLVLVHRDTLLSQAQNKLGFVWPEVKTGRLQGGIYEYDKQITIASVPTLAGRIDEFKAACDRYGEIDLVVYDEAHHICASIWKKIYKFLKETYNPLILGVTATPIRTKKNESLSEFFEDTPYAMSIFQLIQDGFLSPLIGFSVETSLNLTGVAIQHGDYNQKELSKRIHQSNLDKKVVSVWRERASNRKTICFAVDVDHIESLEREFKKAGAKVSGVHGKMPREEQRKILHDFSAGKYNVLVNCILLTEGFDEPSVDCILMARPTSSRILYVQTIGRGIRLFPGKKDCLLVDFTGNSANNSMITMQDLLGFYGLNKAEKIYKERECKKSKDSADSDPFIMSPATIPSLLATDKFGEEFETSLAAKEIDVFDINKFAWNKIGENSFVTVRRNLSLAIKDNRQDGKYVPCLVYADKNDKWLCRLSDPVDKEFAYAIANVYLFDYGDRRLALQSSPWRNEAVTAAQKPMLESAIKRYNDHNPVIKLSVSDIPSTRGEYSSMINALFTLGLANSGKIKHLSKDEVTDILREKIVSEINGSESADTPTAHIKLNITGIGNDEDRQKIMAVFSCLQKDKNAAFPVRFLSENTIEITDNAVRVYSNKYPHYPLTEKQEAFLLDRINRIFRLYFRDKKFEILRIGRKERVLSIPI